MKAKSHEKNVTRRQFLGATVAAAGLMIVPRHVLGGPKFVAPSEKIHIALIGAGAQGRGLMNWLLREEADAQVIAVCDPYEQWDHAGPNGRKPLAADIQKTQGAKGVQTSVADYADFRQLFDKEKALDAIICATPDHWHAFISIHAMKAGKHVYCEKPLAHNIWETRQVARVVKETGVATQMGNMGHSGEGIRRTCEWIWAGAIGPVREVHAWGDGGRYVNRRHSLSETLPVPTGLDWDMWVGPRAMRPYHPDYTPNT